jgi:putative PEP-CTERM system histidine kinase
MWVIPCFLSAGGALLLGVMGVVAWIHGLNGLIVLFPEYLLLGKQCILFGELALPVGLGYVNSTFLQHLTPSLIQSTHKKFLLIGAGAISLSVWLLAWPESVIQQAPNGEIMFPRSVGSIIWGFILLVLVIGLSQLEQILRGARDPLRFQMKFVLIGLGGLAGISIAQASQLLLLPIWKPTYAWVGGIAACISLGLIAFGLARWRIHDFSQKVQVSHQALYTSLTFLGVGGYLILVGIVAEMIKGTGWEIGEALGALLVFVAGMALVIVIVSRQARAELQQFVSRHFFRTKYDYRQKWLEVTEAFSACDDSEQIWDRYLEWLGRTFGAPRVTIWKRFDVDGRYHQIRTVNSEDSPPPIAGTAVLIQRMLVKKEPFMIDGDGLENDSLKEFLQGTEAHICVPLVTPEKDLLGFCTLSKELHDQSYDHDDFDLLRAIAHHVTMLLIQFQLVEERNVTAKWEAVHKFSGFYLHDLKNLASSLSMVVQNAEQYGHDPDFQASAMRTVRTTSQRMMDLMAKLASQSKGLEPKKERNIQAVDMNVLVQETLESLNGAGCRPTFHPGTDIPKRRLKVEPIKQVLLNVILNARQAMDGKGSIDISTASEGQDLKVEIVDTGPGIPMDRLENLFQPFKSSKKTGLGVGLFQCKQMVEDNHGQIRIESQEGHGTKVILTFPAETADR